jgi:hypothetical protein
MANQQRKFSTRVVIPRPDRMRRLGSSGFGWVDARILKDGWLAALSAEAVSVYLFLCLVANPQGISWYRRDRMREALNLHEGAVLQISTWSTSCPLGATHRRGFGRCSPCRPEVRRSRMTCARPSPPLRGYRSGGGHADISSHWYA